jgi:membrane protease YdiL (CAAX protease family)
MTCVARPSPRRSLLVLLAYLAAIAALTGASSPLLLGALHGAGATEATLDAVTMRTLELVAIAGVFPLLLAMGGVAPSGWAPAWGVPPRAGLLRRLSRGIVMGVVSLGAVCVVLFVLEVRVMKVDLVWTPAYWAGVVVRAALAAMAVAVTEELLFRGGLFTALQRAGGAVVALWVGAVVYAAAHFLDAPALPEPHGALSGFEMLGRAAAAVPDPVNLDSFAALLVAGLVLGIVRLREGDVALAIGIHAGWVFTIKVFKKLTHVSEASGLRGLAGHYDDLIGWLAAGMLCVLALTLWWRLPARGRVAR